MPSAETIFAADKFGNMVPTLPVAYGKSLERAVTTTAIAAVAAHDSGHPTQMARVWAIGCDIFYIFGTPSVGAPTLADAFLPVGWFMDIPLTTLQTHFRAVAKAGTGTFRVELLGT
jgi:hypothetical protein